MSRLAVFIDRPPDDLEWKGAMAWNTALALAESQHEVLAVTTLDPATIEVSHSRLTVVQPAKSFGVQYFPRWMRAIFQFQPEIVHTFALRSPGRFPTLTVWPMLEGLTQVMPRVRKYSTAYSPEDFTPFSPVQVPIELPGIQDNGIQHGIQNGIQNTEFGLPDSVQNSVLIPESVSSWHRPQESLLLLNEFLLANRELHAHVVGGWGSLSLTDRRNGWRLLESVNQQVHMGEPLSLDGFYSLATRSKGFWLRPLAPNSWKLAVSAQFSNLLSLPTWGDLPNHLNLGSTANFLSRLYSL